MKVFLPIFILACIFLSSDANAQVYVEDLNLNESEDISIIEIFIRPTYNRGTTVNIDFGQWQKPRVITLNCIPVETVTKSNGEQLVFNSKIHALNHFESNGWALIEINNNAADDTSIDSYYFKKEKTYNNSLR